MTLFVDAKHRAPAAGRGTHDFEVPNAFAGMCAVHGSDSIDADTFPRLSKRCCISGVLSVRTVRLIMTKRARWN